MHNLELSISPNGISDSGEIRETAGWHSNLFAKYFTAYHGDKIEISFPKDLKHRVCRKDYGRSGRYGHFEVRLNGNLCTVCIGDNGYIESSNYEKSKSKVSFISQLNRIDLRKIKPIYERTGHRIYPIPLPLYWHTDLISSGEYMYESGEKEYISNMSFSLRGRSFRIPWINLAMKNQKDFLTKNLQSKDFLDFSVNKQKWGVNLKGHGKGGKCYRESEYMCMGVPLALNYKPIYPFPFEPGVHYFRLRRRKDILKLKDIDPEPFAKASKELGERYIKQEGYLDLMMRCIKQKEYSPILGD